VAAYAAPQLLAWSADVARYRARQPCFGADEKRIRTKTGLWIKACGLGLVFIQDHR
jgi:hypothetical protein